MDEGFLISSVFYIVNFEGVPIFIHGSSDEETKGLDRLHRQAEVVSALTTAVGI